MNWTYGLKKLELAFVCGFILAFGEVLKAEEPKQLFFRNCASCHGKDGKAKTPIARKLGVKDLSQTKMDEGQIKTRIHDGAKDDKGKVRMPSYKDKLSPDEISALVGVVKEFSEKK